MQRTKKRPDSMPEISDRYVLSAGHFHYFMSGYLRRTGALQCPAGSVLQSGTGKTPDRIRCRQYTGFCPAGTD